MSALGLRARLISSALLGALVVSCGGPPIYVVAPAPAAAPAPAPAPQGGLQEAPPLPAPAAAPEPRQVVPLAPAPAAPPPPAPAAPPVQGPAPEAKPWRPGGAPPGTELVELPGGNDLTQWLEDMKDACDKAHYGRTRCLNLHINYIKGNGSHENCNEIKKQSPGIGEMVTTSRSIKLDVRCADNTSTTDDTKSSGSSESNNHSGKKDQSEKRNHSGRNDNPATGTAGK